MATGRACLRGAVRGAPRLAPVVCRSPFRGVAVSAAVCPWTAFGPTLAVPVQIFAPTALPLLSDRPTTSALGEPTRSAPLVLTAPLRLAVGSGARYARECPLAARWLPVGCSLGARWLPVGCSQMIWLRAGCSLRFVGLLREGLWCAIGGRFGRVLGARPWGTGGSYGRQCPPSRFSPVPQGLAPRSLRPPPLRVLALPLQTSGTSARNSALRMVI